MKRSGPIQRKTRLKQGVSRLRQSPMRQRSKKAAVLGPQRRAVVERLAEERGPHCEAKAVILKHAPADFPIDELRALFAMCTHKADDAHELLRRSQGGSVTDPANILLVCRTHHDWIGANPVKAVTLGLAKFRRGDA